MINLSAYLSMLSSFLPIGRKEQIPFINSLGRVLAEDIIANMDQPPFDKSAMDGYACAREYLPGPLTAVGQIAAGSFTEKKLESRTCYRIFTGASIPPGADCVIMQENTTIDNHGNVLFTAKETKNNICYQGEDIKTGEVAIKEGSLIQPQHLAVMAGFGITEVVVYQKPSVGIICSGSELVEPTVKPDKAKIRNSNAYQLMGQLLLIGMEGEYLGIIPDNKTELTKNISNAIGKYNILIVTGGASVGDFDFIPEVLTELNATVHFSNMNIQPGKPVLFATIENTHILGLSGNPVSSYLQFLLVAKPLIFRLSGCTEPGLKIIKTLLTETIKRKKGNRQLFVPVTILPSGVAKPVPFHGSAHILGLIGADGFAIVDEDINEIQVNEPVKILLL